MATLVEVTTSKPTLQDFTLKLTRSDAADLKMFITDWYSRNYAYGSGEKAKVNPIYVAVQKALDGKHEGVTVKINQPAVF